MKQAWEFGFSAENAASAMQLPDEFSVVELFGETLEPNILPLLRRLCAARSVRVRELAPRRLLEELPASPLGIRQDFFQLLSRRCELMQQCGITAATLAPPLLRAVQDEQYSRQLRHFLPCCFGIAQRHEIALALELRLPGGEAKKMKESLAYRRDLLYPLALLTDFHPHEPESFQQLQEVQKSLPFDRALWRITYDAAQGNYLSAEALRRICAAAKGEAGTPPLLIFAPGGDDTENLAALIAGLGAGEAES